MLTTPVKNIPAIAITSAATSAALLALAACATSTPAARHSAPPVTQAPATPALATTPAAPYFPPGPICQAYALFLGVFQQSGADGTVTEGTFRKFARELRIESKLAADDQPLGADLSTAAAVVSKDGRVGAAGGSVDTNTLAFDLEAVRLDCGQA